MRDGTDDTWECATTTNKNVIRNGKTYKNLNQMCMEQYKEAITNGNTERTTVSVDVWVACEYFNTEMGKWCPLNELRNL
jgi:hypothetical protein